MHPTAEADEKEPLRASPQEGPATGPGQSADAASGPKTDPASASGLSRKESSLSKISAKGYHTLRSMATRIRVANQLSIAKRTQAEEAMSGGVLPDEAPSARLARVTAGGNGSGDWPEEPGRAEGVICCGELLFDQAKSANEASHSARRHFLYVTPQVAPLHLASTLLAQWTLPVPRIALFLLSDVGELRTWHNPRQTAAFRSGLMKAANTTSMWIVTHGLDVGVGKLVGDAVEQHTKQQQATRSYDRRSRPRPFTVVGLCGEHNLAYMQDLDNKLVTLIQPGPCHNHHRYELNPMHSNFVLVRSDSPSDDAAHSVVRRLIDFLSTNASLSPQTPLPGGQHQSPFFPAESGSGGQAESLVQPAVTPLEEEEAGDTVDGQTCDVSYVSEAGSVTPEADKPEPDLASMEPDGAGQSGKDPLSRLQEATIPVVCVVIQGDYNSARLVLDNLRRGNPVIVLRGSGGFADLLSYAHMQMKQRCKDLYHSWDAEFVESTLKPLLGGKIAKRFPHLRHNALARNILRDRIVECVRESHSAGGREYLTVLNMHNSSCDLTRLSEFILLSLFKSQNRRAKLNDNLIRKDLYLTLDWNCLHVALDDVLRRNPSYNLQLEKSIFEIALLRNNREDFVDLFLSHGFRVHKYLTPFRLKRLVRYSLLEQDFFRSVCMEAILGIAVWSANFDDLIEKLSPSLPNTESDCFLSHELNQLVFTTTSLHDFVNVDHLYLNIMGLYPVDEDSSERKALAILAMWAVFNRRFRLCEVLWKHSDQPIHLALTVSMMLQRMAWFVADQNLKNDLQAHGRMFEKYAIGVLDACYRQDEKRSFNLLSEENGDWGRKTVVDIAANGSHRNFIAHPCCQKWLTNTFNGRIRVRELNWGILTLPPVLKIVLSAFLVLPMYVWISFLEEHDCSERNERLLEEFSRESDESEEEIAKDHFRLVELDKGPGHKQSSGKSRLASVGRSGQSRYRPRLVLRKQPPLATMLRLMWTSPITKFWTYQVLYILYLAVFSLAVIWPGCGNWYLDATVCFWTFLNLLEHISRTMVLYQRYTSVPMLFKIGEIVGIVVLLSCYTWGRVLFVFSRPDEGRGLPLSDPFFIKVLLCIGLIYFYYRLFAIHLTISPTLGPLLYRFKLMVTVDFIHFMRMALILLISSGIVIQAILYPNTELGLDLFHKAFHRAVISLFLTPVDELTVKCQPRPTPAPLGPSNLSVPATFESLSDFTQSHCPESLTPMAESCPQTGFWSYLFTFQYLICLKLILMTLLYALFANTASRLQTETDNIWKYQRYTIVIDFANRPALQSPLSLLKHCYSLAELGLRAAKACCALFRPHKTEPQVLAVDGPGQTDKKRLLSKDDYSYWRHLAKALFDEQEKKKKEEQIPSEQRDTIQLICEEMEHEKDILRNLKTKLYEMERMMSQTHIYLESLQGAFPSQPRTATPTTHHFHSRHSPYPGTRVNRFPLADKYVPWDVIWINYDPVIFSRKRDNFPAHLKPYVDEDLLALKEYQAMHLSHEASAFHLPVFNWNTVSVNPAGFTIDRKSWLTHDLSLDLPDSDRAGDSVVLYKLQDGIPLNPFGRTGLRGKGNLARWGPNHYATLLVTRSLPDQSSPSKDPSLQFALEQKYNSLHLPTKFVGDDKPFGELSSLFGGQCGEWRSEEEMLASFHSPSPLHSAPVARYLDSPENTDNAWKEVRLYHLHFPPHVPPSCTEPLLGPSMKWTPFTEDLSVRLPVEQVALLNLAVKMTSALTQST